MKEQLLHILDESTCLTRRQLKEYIAGTMLPEEIHAVETHLASCPLCSMAMEGYELHSEEALAAIDGLNSGFLKDHFDSITPQIHLNSLAPSATIAHGRRKKTTTISFWKVSAAAAAILVCFGVIWYLQNTHSTVRPLAIVQESSQTPPEEIPANTNVNPVTSDRAPVQTVAPAKTPAALTESKPVNPPPAAKVAAAPEVIQAEPASPAKDQEDTETRSTVATHNTARYTLAETSIKQQEDREQTDELEKKQQKMMVARTAAAPAAIASNREKEQSAADRNPVEKGDELFEHGQYKQALNQYKIGMNNSNRSERHLATLMAARCYSNMGQKTKAIELLRSIVDEGGPQKRNARRLLRNLEGKEQ